MGKDFQHANAGAIVDRGELIEPPAGNVVFAR
jgi:hypothetical protein